MDEVTGSRMQPGQIVVHYSDMIKGMLIEKQTEQRGVDYWDSISWSVWVVLTENNQLEIWSEGSMFFLAPFDDQA